MTSDESTTQEPTETNHRRFRRGGEEEGRPRSVYVILFGGVALLVVLLIIVYLSSDRSIPDQPICSSVTIEQAQTAVLEGRIRGITVAYDDTVEPPSAWNWGPVLMRVSYTDGQCAILPQGIEHRNGLYQVIGAITVYNDITENQKIEIKYDHSTALDPMLFATPTAIPTNTPVPSPTPTPTEPPKASPTPSAPIIGPVPIPATPDPTP
ncbi:MAG: hypothetical protein M9953_03230 [Thermomicrobiales bacterium]|nr:hypothetical protein [Thermomicrobiales bacterium]MCO5218653.1 hypothetical protein [Thermomicrobiales bacterium]MCO5224330.1 hypothetical protein [Thermomicrobiales bacterium]MCO5229068.1 hypothetical protein [Thermomicrobiales bacterium]